jgi:hypothetical protein
MIRMQHYLGIFHYRRFPASWFSGSASRFAVRRTWSGPTQLHCIRKFGRNDSGRQELFRCGDYRRGIEIGCSRENLHLVSFHSLRASILSAVKLDDLLIHVKCFVEQVKLLERIDFGDKDLPCSSKRSWLSCPPDERCGSLPCYLHCMLESTW